MLYSPAFERVYPTDGLVPDESSRRVLLAGRSVLVPHQPNTALPTMAHVRSADLHYDEPIPIARIGSAVFFAASVDESLPVPPGWEALDLRSLYGRVSEAEWSIAGYASQILRWRRTSGYCPVCGGAMSPLGSEWRRQCLQCGHERYPMVTPAVLALVHDGGDRILLAHKPGWGARRSILAGFTLPGESLEECVHREVMEEAGVTVTELTYFGSQPWPFPHQLMIGFCARYMSGDIVIDAEELAGADWYDRTALPPLPPPLSLSRQMIDAWAKSRSH